MLTRIIEKIKKKQHIIVITILTIYLCALAIKTGQVFYTEYWTQKPATEQTQPQTK